MYDQLVKIGGMNLKAITLATMSALALAGAACSDSDPQNIETAAAETAEVVPASASASNSGFNLPDPIASAPGSGSNGGFNLSPPPTRDAAPSGSGFNLPDSAPSDGGLSTLPAFQDPATSADSEPVEPDEDEIIRLDP